MARPLCFNIFPINYYLNLLIIIIIIIIIIITPIEFSLGDSSPYTSTDKINKNKYTQTKQYKNTVQTIQNTVNTSTHITKTPQHTLSHTLRNITIRNTEPDVKETTGLK